MNKKIAIVTGGTRGIGLASVKAFLNEGYKVILFGSREETVNKALEELHGKDVEGKWIDLTNEVLVNDVFNEIYKENRSIDVLVNNAGITDTTPFLEYDLNKFDKVMDINLKAVYVATNAAAKIMKEQNHGVILNTSSMVSLYGQSTGVAYPTSKYAINGFTKSLARELGKYGIRVNAVAPGIINTDMIKNLPKETIGPLINSIPLRRIGEASDIANAFVFLASDKASYITGTVLSVDGAMMA